MSQDNNRKERASAYFHNESNNWNCAQAIHKAQQGLTGLTDEQIELTYRSKGGGRAEGGLCGAIYAATKLVPEQDREMLIQRFRQRTGGQTCAELKGRLKIPCPQLVDVAEEILLDYQQNRKYESK